MLPIVVYGSTFVVASKLLPGFCGWYRMIGATLVFGGGGVSVYFAGYTGDQGGIAAFYFQVLVVIVYLLFSGMILIGNGLMQRRLRSN